MAKLRLKAALKRRKMTKYGFAKALGMSYKNVFRLFKPTYDPTLSTLTRFAKALKLKVRDLIKE